MRWQVLLFCGCALNIHCSFFWKGVIDFVRSFVDVIVYYILGARCLVRWTPMQDVVKKKEDDRREKRRNALSLESINWADREYQEQRTIARTESDKAKRNAGIQSSPTDTNGGALQHRKWNVPDDYVFFGCGKTKKTWQSPNSYFTALFYCTFQHWNIFHKHNILWELNLGSEDVMYLIFAILQKIEKHIKFRSSNCFFSDASKFLIGVVNPYSERKKYRCVHRSHCRWPLWIFGVYRSGGAPRTEGGTGSIARGQFAARKKKESSDRWPQWRYFFLLLLGFFRISSWIIVFAQSSWGALKLLNMWTVV